MSARRIAARRWRLRFVALAVLLVVLTYSGLHTLAATHADRLIVTVRSSAPLSGDTTHTVIFSSTMTAAAGVAAAQAAINGTPTLSLGEDINCPLGTFEPLYTYDVSFYWRGILVETAQTDTSGCLFWWMRTLGMPNLLTHLDLAHLTALCTLRRLTDMPLPKSWSSPCL